MHTPVKRVFALALVVPLAAACVTKGQFRRALQTERVARDSAITAERMDRVAADSALAADIGSLRTDLQTMRTEFGARITAMADSLQSTVQFALPVHFDFDEDMVREHDRMALDRFSQVVNRYYPGAAITVEGFADPAGSTQYNLALSQRRANAVRDYLAQRGFEGVPVRAVGYGEARPVVAGAERDMPGAEMNRRVVFVIEAGQQAAQLTASVLR